MTARVLYNSLVRLNKLRQMSAVLKIEQLMNIKIPTVIPVSFQKSAVFRR